jgi:hypothetical protein
MKKLVFLTLAALLVMGGNGLFGQASKTVNITVNLAAWYSLSVTPAALTFNDAIPPAVPIPPAPTTIDANENPVAVRAFAILLPGKTLRLTLKANGTALQGTAAGNTIAFDAIKWTTPSVAAGFVGGTLSMSDETVGSWLTNWYHDHSGDLNFTFDRDYTTQAPDTYTATATYTLSGV